MRPMKMIRITLFAAALSLAVSTALAANVHLGTWKLNESKSKLAAGTPQNTMVTYRTGDNGTIKLTCDGIDKDGKATRWTWQGKFDGKQYKVKGAGPADSMAYTIQDSHTNMLQGVRHGKVVLTGTIQVAPDGKSRKVTTTIDDKTTVSYYDKL